MANEDEAATLDAETIRRDGKTAGMADPREGTDLAMTTARIVTVTRISIAPLAATMTKGKAPAAMTETHREERTEVVAAESSHRTARANADATLRHPHPEALMAAVAVAAGQQGRATLARIRRTRSPTMPVPI
jgi:hypothetical protein